MKVLQILPELNAGGVERGTLEIADFLVRNRHEAIVVSNGGRLVPMLEKSGAQHITLAVHKRSPRSFFKVRPFRRILEQERPDILHVRSRLPGWIAWLAWRKMDARTRPHLVTTVHGFYSVNAYSAIMTHGERIIAVSESIRDYVVQNYSQTRSEIIRMIPRGIEPKNYARDFKPDTTWMEAWQRQFPQLTGKRVLTLPGRITRLKGHEDFLKLIKALVQSRDSVHGLIVGDVHTKKQSYLDEIKSFAAQSDIADHVTFTGHRPDLREVFAVSDVVFSLSTQPESFGRTTLEALALGRPVVAYDHGGVGEQLRVMFPAGRVPLRNEAALLQTTWRVLAGVDNPGPVPLSYTLQAMCTATLDTYAELLRNG